MVVIGRNFKNVEDFYTIPCRSSLLGISKVSKLSELKMWPCESIAKNVLGYPLETPLLLCHWYTPKIYR